MADSSPSNKKRKMADNDENSPPNVENSSANSQLLERLEHLEQNYEKLRKAKFADISAVFDKMRGSSKEKEEAHQTTIKVHLEEVKRWRGDRQYTSKQLQDQLNAMTAKYEQSQKELQHARETIGGLEAESKQKDMEIFGLKQKLSDEQSLAERTLMAKTGELVAVNQDLQKKLDNHLEDHERGEKAFQGRLASERMKWASERAQDQERMRDLYDQVSHWNREALNMEDRMRVFEKRCIRLSGGSASIDISSELGDALKEKEAVQIELAKVKKALDDERKMRVASSTSTSPSPAATNSGFSSLKEEIMTKKIEFYKMFTGTELHFPVDEFGAPKVARGSGAKQSIIGRSANDKEEFLKFTLTFDRDRLVYAADTNAVQFNRRPNAFVLTREESFDIAISHSPHVLRDILMTLFPENDAPSTRAPSSSSNSTSSSHRAATMMDMS